MNGSNGLCQAVAVRFRAVWPQTMAGNWARLPAEANKG